MKQSGIKVAGHTGTWYVIAEKERAGKKVFLLESELYGEEANAVVVNSDVKLLFSAEWNGFDDYEEALESRLFNAIEEKYGINRWRNEDWLEGELMPKLINKYWSIVNVDSEKELIVIDESDIK